jgi:integral membrane protein|tara:strand:+ start:45670 stop:45978 length:309 start_codon:yes stop_codon:yes gene_type:complete
MKFNTSISQFRTLAILEGISYLLLGFTMILKYSFEMPLPNKIVGYAHGVLFIAYMAWLYLNFVDRKWSFKILVLLFLASLIPFGTFIADHKFLKKEEQKSLK